MKYWGQPQGAGPQVFRADSWTAPRNVGNVMTQPTILVVEDNPADVYLISEAIRQNEVEVKVQVVSDGESAIQYIKNQTDLPAVIVLDLNLPKWSGIHILEAIRSRPQYRDIPVIVFTSSLSEHDHARLGPLGVKACLLKSLDLDEFNRIGAVIKQVLFDSARL
jgi:CheY-like chemotaxis protein